MSSQDYSELADAAFERALLESARVDRPPATADAWARFAAASAAMAGAAKMGDTPGRSWSWKPTSKDPWRWLAIGAVIGGGVTAAVLGWRSNASPVAGHVNVAAGSGSSAPALAPGARVVGAVEPEEREPSNAGNEHRLPARARAAQQVVRARRAAPRASTRAEQEGAALPASALSAERASSTLAAEIAALDTVRRAIAAGDYVGALREADAYPRSFPQGQLAVDADALAVEALAVSGKRAAARARAERFLAKYPNDPHAARIRTLIAE
jgi:hypothetical protein